MKKLFAVFMLCIAAPMFAGIVTPDDFGGPYCPSLPFDTATCAITTQYIGGGLLFSQNGVGTAAFNDPPDAWAGINGDNIVDLLTPVNVAIVMPGTTNPGTTDTLSVEAGYADSGTLLLTAFDIFGNVLGTRVNGLDGNGPHGRTLMVLNLAGISWFSVSTPGGDTFGVNQITVGDIVPGGEGVPEPATFVLLGAGLCLLACWKKKSLK